MVDRLLSVTHVEEPIKIDYPDMSNPKVGGVRFVNPREQKLAIVTVAEKVASQLLHSGKIKIECRIRRGQFRPAVSNAQPTG